MGCLCPGEERGCDDSQEERNHQQAFRPELVQGLADEQLRAGQCAKEGGGHHAHGRRLKLKLGLETRLQNSVHISKEFGEQVGEGEWQRDEDNAA